MTTVIVKNSRFISHSKVEIPKGTVKAELVDFQLDKSWDGMSVFIHWNNLGTNVEKRVLLKDPTQHNEIPWEVLTDLGELRMGLVGMDGETTVKPTIWLMFGRVVEGPDADGGEDTKPPTPGYLEQMVEQAEAAANAAKEAKETADRLQRAAESGEFNGDPGPEGPPGKSPIIKDSTWWIWSVEDQAYKDTGILASGGGGGGVSSYNDLSDRPKIGGVLLEGDKTAQDLGLQPKGNYATTSSKLANPFSITFTGAVEATYDGSQEKTVEIPTIAGPAGVSPTVSTEELDSGTRVTFTFKGGSETVDIMNGKTPVKGTDYFTDDEIHDVVEQAAALVPSNYHQSLEAEPQKTMSPNTYYVWGEMASLDITLGKPIDGITNEYCGQFTSGATATTFSAPESVRWVGGLSVPANSVCQFSIVDNVGVMVSVTA